LLLLGLELLLLLLLELLLELELLRLRSPLSWLCFRLLGLELSSVSIEPEVPVGGVRGVYEGVPLGPGFLPLGCRSGVGNPGGSPGSGVRNRPRGFPGFLGERTLESDFRVVGRGVETIGSGGNMGSLQDPESILAGSVAHCDGLTLGVYVAVLAHPLPVSRYLLPGDSAILLGIG